MKNGPEITAAQILRGTSAPTVSTAEVVATFRRRFETRPDVGIWKRLLYPLFGAPNPFDTKSRRRVRQEAIILGTLTFAAIALATYFNLNATSR